MAPLIVVDSGIVLATVLQETFSERAHALTEAWNQEETQLHAPALFRYEVVAVMRKALFRGRLAPQEAVEGLDVLLAYPVQFHLDNALLKRGHELATRYNRPTAYDAQYLAVAERLECDFWTADDRLFNAVAGELTWVKRLSDFG